MKNFAILITLLISTIALSAQGQKGMKVLEGNLSYSFSEQENMNTYDPQINTYKSQRLAIMPKIGWFVSKSSVVGTGIGFEYSQQDISSLMDSKSKEHLFSLSPYFRNYQKITEKLFFTSTIELALGIGKESRNDDFKMDIFEISLTARPGLSYFLSNNWALKTNFGSLYYRKTNKKVIEGHDDQQPKLNDTSLGINISMESFSLGIGYYF